MKKILVPIDGSDLSKKAAEQAVILAKTYRSEITFMTVVEMKYQFVNSDYGIFSTESITITDDLLELDKQRSRKMLDAIVNTINLEDLIFEEKVLIGDPHPEIVSYAKEGQFDLIVMGHRGLNPLQRIFIGSVTKRVIEDSPCSIMVIK